MRTITLWVGNRLDGEIQKPFSDVLEEFKNSSYFERYIFEPETYLRDMLLLFITAKDGLNSTYDVEDPTDFEDLYDYIRAEVKKEF